MSLVTANNKKIEKAFSLLARKKDHSAQMAMEKALKDAVKYAMDLHEEDGEHGMHLNHNKHYGWILLHNGVVNTKGLYCVELDEDLEMPDGYASEVLDMLADDLPIQGWEGIVVAGMGPGYSHRFENWVLDKVIQYTKSAFPVHIAHFVKEIKK